MEWKLAGSLTEKEFKVTPFASKFMDAIFWNSCGVIPIEYLKHGYTINGIVIVPL